MMFRSILLKSLWDFRKAALYWAGGIFFLAIYIIFIVSQVPLDQFAAIADALPKAVQQFVGGEGGVDFGSIEGFLNAQIFTILAPIMIIGLAVNSGGKATASEETSKSLDMVLSAPISRERFIIEKILAMIIKVAFVAVIHWLAYAISGVLFSETIPLEGLFAVCLNLFLLGVTFGMLGIMIGAFNGNAAQAVGISAALALISYLIANIAPLVETLDSTKYISLFHYYKSGDPLKEGIHAWHWAPFVGCIIIFFITSVFQFRRRNLL